MTDPKTLVERLHSCRISAPPEHAAHPYVCDEAADRIKELEAIVASQSAIISVTVDRHDKLALALFDICHLSHLSRACDVPTRIARDAVAEIDEKLLNQGRTATARGGKVEVSDG